MHFDYAVVKYMIMMRLIGDNSKQQSFQCNTIPSFLRTDLPFLTQKLGPALSTQQMEPPFFENKMVSSDTGNFLVAVLLNKLWRDAVVRSESFGTPFCFQQVAQFLSYEIAE